MLADEVNFQRCLLWLIRLPRFPLGSDRHIMNQQVLSIKRRKENVDGPASHRLESLHAGLIFTEYDAKIHRCWTPTHLGSGGEMQIEAVIPETGERFALKISPEELEQLVRDTRPKLSKKQLEHEIHNLGFSAEVKALLASFTSATIKIGNVVLNIGRRILEIVFDLVKRYPNFTFALVTRLVGALLLVVVPWLTPIVGPLMTAMDLGFALVKDYLEGRKEDNASKDEQPDNRPLAKDYLKHFENESIFHDAQEAIQPFEALNAVA